MPSTPAARLFARALQESLTEFRKHAFVPADPAQAAGPGGAPVGGAPMDPMAAGGAPGMPPMDPMAAGGAGAPPMDPMMGGAPPMPGGDPMAGGMPPMPGMDPMAAGMDPMMGAPPPEGGEGDAGLTKGDVESVEKITQRTMDIVRQTLEMVGKAKPAQPAEAAPAPESAPGPVTGKPGLPPDAFGTPGTIKSASRGILKHLLK